MLKLTYSAGWKLLWYRTCEMKISDHIGHKYEIYEKLWWWGIMNKCDIWLWILKWCWKWRILLLENYCKYANENIWPYWTLRWNRSGMMINDDDDDDDDDNYIWWVNVTSDCEYRSGWASDAGSIAVTSAVQHPTGLHGDGRRGRQTEQHLLVVDADGRWIGSRTRLGVYFVLQSTLRIKTRYSSGDEIANVNFLYDDIVHALKMQ